MNEDIEAILQKLEDLATSLDDQDHGKTVNANYMADLLDEVVRDYREVFGDE